MNGIVARLPGLVKVVYHTGHGSMVHDSLTLHLDFSIEIFKGPSSSIEEPYPVFCSSGESNLEGGGTKISVMLRFARPVPLTR